MYVLLALFVLTGHCAAQDRRPTISFITQPEIVTDIGGNIEMKCTVNYASDYPVIWMRLDNVERKNDLPITSGTTLILKDPRFKIDFDAATSSYTLQIRDIQETDGARYQCQLLISLTDVVKAEVPLIVRRPPIISDNSTRSVVSYVGQTIELRCYASGYPQPDIYWRRQNNDILPTNSSVYKGNILRFEAVRKEDRGTYYCVATNVVGTGARRNIDVEVEFAPDIRIERRRLGQALNYDKDLECHIEAFPPPAIQWYEDGKTEPITNNQHFRISHFAHDEEYVDTTLRVITIEKRQYGNYSCTATNRFGSASGKVELFEEVIPICPPACDSYASFSTNPAVRVQLTVSLSSVAAVIYAVTLLL